MKVRRKQTELDAIQFDGTNEAEVREFCRRHGWRPNLRHGRFYLVEDDTIIELPAEFFKERYEVVES